MELELTDDNFIAEVLNSKLPVLVDFFADWCGPCQMQGPIVDDLAKEYEGKFKIAKMNVDFGQETAGNFQVMSIPTLIFFKDGQPVERLNGMQSKQALKEKIEALLSS
jgi:thioredoxin 1